MEPERDRQAEIRQTERKRLIQRDRERERETETETERETEREREREREREPVGILHLRCYLPTSPNRQHNPPCPVQQGRLPHPLNN